MGTDNWMVEPLPVRSFLQRMINRGKELKAGGSIWLWRRSVTAENAAHRAPLQNKISTWAAAGQGRFYLSFWCAGQIAA
jgi:hypothetical protein